MSNSENLTNHSYDGIQEYDNPLPGWWMWLFGLSVVYSFVYLFYFHAGTEGRTIHDEYNRETTRQVTKRFGDLKLDADAQTILKYMNYEGDPEREKFFRVGETTYKTNCVSCHGLEGQGLVGLNLTDDLWKNVNTIEDVARVIENGAANGAMPAWKTRLSHPNLIVLTAAYVAKMRGKNLPDGNTQKDKGREIPPWPTYQPTSDK